MGFSAISDKLTYLSSLSLRQILTGNGNKVLRVDSGGTGFQVTPMSATPAASTAPISDTGGKLDGWISTSTTSVPGIVTLAADNGVVPGTVVQATDSRLGSASTSATLQFGDGSDGAVDFNGSAVTGFTLNGNVYTYTGTAKVLQYNPVVIRSGKSVQTAGCPIYGGASITFEANASINADGGAASGTTGGTAITYVANAFLTGGSSGVNGVTFGTNGTASSAVSAVALGQAGGTGGASNSSGTNRTGGAGGAVTPWTSANAPYSRLVTDYFFRSGTSNAQAKGGSGGGSGGSSRLSTGTSTSGGSGAGAGALVVAAKQIIGASGARISANGGTGGAPSVTGDGFAGGGGGGSGGGVIVFTQSITGPLTVSADGGLGGAAGVGSGATAQGPNGGNGGPGGTAAVYYLGATSLTVTAAGATGGAGAGSTGSTGSTGASGITLTAVLPS